MLTASTSSPRHRAMEHGELLLGNKGVLAKVLQGLYDERTPLIGSAPKSRLTVLQLLKLSLFMDRNAHKEEFSYAYIHAVAAAAEYSCANATRLLDMEGIDVTITALGVQGTRRCPRIDLQVKCTSRTDIVHEDAIHYPLEVAAYNNLRFDDPTIPYLLVIVLVPEDPDNWLLHSEEEFLLRHCGHWKSLAGESTTRNTTSITVHVPRANLFTPEALKDFMQNLGTGGTV